MIPTMKRIRPIVTIGLGIPKFSTFSMNGNKKYADIKAMMRELNVSPKAKAKPIMTKVKPINTEKPRI